MGRADLLQPPSGALMRGFSQLSVNGDSPSPVKRGGLNGSTHHLPEAYF
jgi:hypothetical protein